MDRKLKWRFAWMGLLVVLAICTLLPSVVSSKSLPPWFSSVFKSKVQLGLDLQGGLQIVYSVDLNKAVDDKASEVKRDLDDALLEDEVTGALIRTPLTPVGAVTITSDDPATIDKVVKSYLGDYDEILVSRDCPDADKNNSKCFRVSSDYADRIKESALEQAIKTVRDRVSSKGIAEPSIVRKGDDIIVELPGLDEEEIGRVKSLIKRTAKLEFKIVDNGSDYMNTLSRHVDGDAAAKELEVSFDNESWVHDDSGDRFSDAYVQAQDRTEFVPEQEARDRGCWAADKPERDGKFECDITGRDVLEKYLAALFARNPELKIDDNHQIGYEKLSQRPGSTEAATWRTYYMHRTVELAGSAVSQADVVFNPTTNRPEVLITFNRYGGRRFGELTSKNVGRKMTIILDDKVSSAPVIQASITGGRSTITMGGSDANQIQTEAEDLVAVLRTGSLPAPLKEESESILGPTLGRDAVDKAKFSFALGSAVVVLIMVWVYRFSGIISIVAIIMNLTFMMAVLAAFGAELTLPGIAALVLTVGMAVDANIIIYERIREELRAGKSVRGAVDAGFDRGFAAIIDGQLTTAAAGYVLFSYGSGPIQGFATMLLIGILCTLFTAYWCTRRFFEAYVSRNRNVIGI